MTWELFIDMRAQISKNGYWQSSLEAENSHNQRVADDGAISVGFTMNGYKIKLNVSKRLMTDIPHKPQRPLHLSDDCKRDVFDLN